MATSGKATKRKKRTSTRRRTTSTRRTKSEAAVERGPGKFTAEKKAEFLAAYEAGLTVREAAAKVGVSSVCVFNHVRSNEEFARQYHTAMEVNTDALEDGLHTLARNGNVAAIFGTLKARRPERWRDRMDLSNQDGSLLKPLAEAIKRAHGIGTETDGGARPA